MRWWTSDLHLGHANICAYSGRPYRRVEDMNTDLIERWNDRVASDDEVYVLGDVAMGHIADTLPLIELLHGAKTLVPGNHDRCWSGLRAKRKSAVDKWTEEYAAVGFTIVEGPTEIGIGGHRVMADHFPYFGDSQDQDRYVGSRPEDCGMWLLHGHVHEKWRQMGRMINVGVDAWGGFPVAESQLLELINQGPAELPLLPWHR
ncbi:MAG TPA: hypothetical protein VFH70_09560 [Acidimicrobiales bacterium]|nr:hypothetical protein [Acidimicrobiales bacterium]